MAIVQYRARDRQIRHIKKKINVTLKGLRLSAICGRFTGPRVLVVSLPKAGTHLLEGVLEELPGIRNAGWKTLSEGAAAHVVIERRLNRIGRGMFANAHLAHSDWIMEIMRSREVKVIFMIRDPRDIAVSRYKYVAEIDYLHPANKLFSAMENDAERLSASIVGIEGIMPGIGEMLERFQGWIGEESVLVLRFEDLIGARGGGVDEVRFCQLKRILQFLGIYMTEQNLELLDKKIYRKTSSTHRKGIIGSWHAEYSEEHTRAFHDAVGCLLNRYGYE